MVFVPADGGSSDTIAVDTEALKATAPAFRQAGQQVDTTLQNLVSSVQIAGGDMFLLLEFARMASMLEQLQERIGVAMQCAAGGLKRIGTSLEIASGLYVENEDTLSATFTQLEDDKNPWKLPTLFNPAINPGVIAPTIPQPVPTPQPGIQLQPGIQPAQQPNGPVIPLPNVLPLE